MEALLKEPDSSSIEALVIGAWDFESASDSSELVQFLAGNKDALPNLRALFFGDIEYEEQEMSWIQQSDVTPLLLAYPRLEELVVRGGGTELRPGLGHDGLRRLTFQTGGMSSELAKAVCSADLPNLEHLELWTGAEDYGAEVTTGHLGELFGAKKLPGLRSLGLRNSEITDAIVEALSMSPITRQLSRLDVSMGTLTDAGARTLMSAREAFEHLEAIEASHHYCTPEVVEELRGSGLKVTIEDPQEADDWGDGDLHRYVSVGE
jgi:hypothetical protein